MGVLALLTFSNRLALWLHIPVQLISIGALMTQHNAEMCASALMKNEVGDVHPVRQCKCICLEP